MPVDELRALRRRPRRRLATRHGAAARSSRSCSRRTCEADARRARRSSPATRSRSRRWPAPTATTRPHRALRAVRRRPRAGQRLQRAQRPGRAAPALRGRAARPRRPATSRRARSTRTTCGPSSTACRRPAASASASTGWRCCSPACRPSRKSSSSRRCGPSRWPQCGRYTPNTPRRASLTSPSVAWAAQRRLHRRQQVLRAPSPRPATSARRGLDRRPGRGRP